MNLHIRNVIINDPASPQHGEKHDVIVRDGHIHIAGPDAGVSADCEIVEAAGAYLSPGWFDMRVQFGEPGFEQKETIRSGQEAAAQGGFTSVLQMPATSPPVETASSVAFIREKAAGHWVNVYPAGALTVNRAGKDMAGLFEMKQSGALAFTDGKRFIEDSGVMLRLLQYAGNIGTVVITYADEPGLTSGLYAGESPSNTALGLKGAPQVAEAMGILRDMKLVEYTGQRVHVSGISTLEGVEAIREAKRKGLPVTAETYVVNLLLDDSRLDTFHSNYKVRPPLRDISDVLALREAVLDGTIDVVCSDHSPEAIESKAVEFEYAAFGIIGLESFYGALSEAMGDRLTSTRLYELLVSNPRKILGLDVPVLKTGARADFTVYHPHASLEFLRSRLKSKSSNTPFIGHVFPGRVLACGNSRGGVVLT